MKQYSSIHVREIILPPLSQSLNNINHSKNHSKNVILFHDIDCLESSIEKNIKMAEKYLIKVGKRGTECKNFNELRVWSYCHSKCALIEKMPPTSASIR